MRMSEGIQEAILLMSGVVQYEQLEAVVKDALELTLPNVSDTIVYLQTPNGQDLVSSQGMYHALPKKGLAWDCIQRRERLVTSGLHDADPLSGLLQTGISPLRNNRKGLLCCVFGWRHACREYVVCSPVIDGETDRIVAVLVAVCDQLSNEDHFNLSFLEKQFLACHHRLKETSQVLLLAKMDREKSETNSTMLELCADLYDQDAASLQIKVIHHLVKETKCQSAFLLFVDPDHMELFCQVIGDKVLPNEIRIPQVENDSFATLIRTKKTFTLADLNTKNKEQIEKIWDYRLTSLLCVPICNRIAEDVVAIACLVNKRNAASFSETDVEVVQNCFKYTATVLYSTLAVQKERRLKNQTQALLQVAKNLFTHLDDLTLLLREIMQEARNLTHAERCSVFLLEKETDELVAKVFDGEGRDGKEMLTEVRIPADQGIAGHVATTGKYDLNIVSTGMSGELLNIDDAYTHPLFYRGVDESTGFRTRNILCFPIKDENDEVIGVAQLCNKLNHASFTAFDEEIAQAFSIYCCISIVHTLLYKTVRDAQHRSRLSNELMIYHMQVQPEEVAHLSSAEIPDVSYFGDMDKFTFTPRSISFEASELAVHTMLQDMGFISKYRIGREQLARFVLMVRKGYRDPPYHNWSHAFAVAHFCYLCYKNVGLFDYFEEIEVFALFLACLGHDIDHRGTTNSYQVESGSVLARLYSSEGSVMERHHFSQTMCIINTEGGNILENLPKNEYGRVLDLIKDLILATDLAHHLRILKDIKQMAEDGYNKNNRRHRKLLLCLLMTSCDLSDQTKHWQNSKRIAEMIYQEFFRQGDLEKELGRNPSEMMDREKASIPTLQIGFLDGIALPVFRLLATFFPRARVVVDAVENNKRMWLRMNDKIHQLHLNTSMDIFDVEVEPDQKS